MADRVRRSVAGPPPRGAQSGPTPFQFACPRWPGLAKLAEECGEVVQVVGKIIGTGGTMTFRDGQVIDRSRLVEEMADLEAIIGFVVEHAFTEAEKAASARRQIQKIELFERWRTEELTDVES